MLEDSPTGRHLDIEITPEMIEAGVDEIYQHLVLEPGCGDARECALAVFKVMMNLARSRYPQPSR